MWDLATCSRALRQSEQAMARLLKAQALSAAQDWAAERRARTRHLIELGGLVVKAGLVELAEDDRATLLGGFQDLADRLRGCGPDDERPADLKARWRRRGLRTFDADAAAKASGGRETGTGEDVMSSA